MSTVKTTIEGLQTGLDKTGSWPVRMDFDDFIAENNAKQAFLFVAAFIKLQNRKAHHPLSYFQIAGIHGFPYRSWPPVPGEHDGTKELFQYCAHGDSTFTTWHRVYLLLIEQALQDLMWEMIHPDTPYSLVETDDQPSSPILKEERAGYQEAVETWRLPYWDFALHRPYNQNQMSIPLCATTDNLSNAGILSKTLQSIAPEWLAKQKHNPFYAFHYPFEGKSPDSFGVRALSNNEKTTRYPQRQGSEMVTNINRLMEGFSSRVSYNLRTDLTDCLNLNIEFDSFAISLSGTVHGTVHLTTGGGGGNMSRIPTAAFDPLFFIYHCGIDRLIALWQYGHDDLANENFWFKDGGEVVGENKPLRPFLHDNGTPWTSKDARNITDLGYNYAVLTGVNNEVTMNSKIANMYSDPKVRHPKEVPYDIIARALFPIAQLGPFTLTFWWKLDNSEDIKLGSIVNFVSSVNAPCTNCATHRAAGSMTTLSTNLSPILKTEIYHERLITISPSDLDQDLKKNLYWTYEKHEPTDFKLVAPEELPLSLDISVVAIRNIGTAIGNAPESGGPTEPPTLLLGATEGKPRGRGPN